MRRCRATWPCAIPRGGLAGLQEVQDYLYQAMHGWQVEDAANKFARLQTSVYFAPYLDVVEGTELPSVDDMGEAIKSALAAYHSLDFGLEFEVLPDRKEPSCVKYVRKGKKIYVEYNYDLVVEMGVQDETQCNWLPLQAGLPVPPVLQAFKDAGIGAHYQMTLEIECTPKS